MLPTEIKFEQGKLVISREAMIEHKGRFYSAFECNTVIVRVEHPVEAPRFVVFPRGYLSRPFDRDSFIATACGVAGEARARGERVGLVPGA